MLPDGDQQLGHLPNTSKLTSWAGEIARLSTAYEEALRMIGVKDRNDPLTELIAKKIIESARPASKTRRKFASEPSKYWACRKR